MRKLFFLLLMLALYLNFPTPAMSEFYVIRLKNGNSLATPLCWSEGGQVYFFYAGGTVGVEKQAVERVEKHRGERNFSDSSAAAAAEKKELPPSSPAAENASELDKRPAEIERKPQAGAKQAEAKKDPSLVLEFNNLEKKFESRKNMSADELKELRYDLAELRGKIVSSSSEAQFREEANKITEMRRAANDLLNMKASRP